MDVKALKGGMMLLTVILLVCSQAFAVDPVHFVFTSNTGDSYSVLILSAKIDSEDLAVGNEIGVFTPDGLCAGAVAWEGAAVGLAAWVDDTQTPAVDGFHAGEEMSFKVWDQSADEELEATAEYVEGNGKYGEGAGAVVNLTIAFPRLYGDVTGNGEITPYDASWVLQHTVGLRVLTGQDSMTADVSGMMGISAYDASLILQYVVGKIHVFPVEQGGTPDPTTKAVASLRTVSMGQISAQLDGRLSIFVLIDDIEGVVAGEMTLSFSGDLRGVEVGTSDLTSGYLLASNVQKNRLKVSFAGAESRSGPGAMLDLVFDESDGTLLSSLRLERVSLNEGTIPVHILEVECEEPIVYWLRPNYPNPFNPETTIRYGVAKASRVRLSIYALTGQQIRMLVDGEHSAGSYSVLWDGKDNAGRDVAGGVYVCRMETSNYSAVRKLVLVR